MIRAPSAEKSSTPIGTTSRSREERYDRIRLALELMHRHCGRELTVGEIAGRLGLSASRFEHLFKAGRGRGFKAELRDIRLSRAKGLLAERTLRVKEVAAQCGRSEERRV